MTTLPYFDLLLAGRRSRDPASALFDRFVHWGYWENQPSGPVGAEALAIAMERLDREVVGAAGLKDGQSVLDAGCGFGGTLAGLSASGRDFRLTGLNLDRRQLAVARGQAQASWVAADACRLPFAAASFHRVLAVECIFHFPSRLRFLQEAARVLRPGGRIALSDFVPQRPGKRGWLGRKVEALIARGYGSVGDGWPDGGYSEMAEKSGLKVTLDRDITQQTLPTYPALLALIAKGAMGGPGGPMALPTRLLAWASRLGVVRYRIVSFEKR